ncbi:hypothetical protein [Nakamurella endophytica]|nr:hypothetical protein [Nakamurella endophytica]
MTPAAPAPRPVVAVHGTAPDPRRSRAGAAGRTAATGTAVVRGVHR